MPLNPAVSSRDTSINEVCEQYDCDCRSDHRAPTFLLASYIDPHVTSQVRVFVVAFKVSAAGIHMSFIIVIKVVLSFIFGHDITSCVYCYLFFVFKQYSMQQIRQCEPVGCWVVGESYQVLLFIRSLAVKTGHLNLHPPILELPSGN